MSKIFRLHTDGSQNVLHWTEMNGHLHDGLIDKITDPSNATAQTQITSIPSPFARLDLVKTAFRYVVSRQQLDGSTIYHKIISDCLDVAELFFNFEALQGKLELIEWRSGQIPVAGELKIEENSELGGLLNSNNPRHRLAGETLKMFLSQDDRSFNFDEMKSLFLINYRSGPEPVNIIGGTSPSTLFFSSANDLSFVDIEFGNHRVFSDRFAPLYQRGKALVLYLFSLRKAFPFFAEKFADIDAYLHLTYSALDDAVKQEVLASGMTAYEENYRPLSVGAENNHAEINGFSLRVQNVQAIQNSGEEDFSIATTKSVRGQIPVVLPLEPFSEEMRYAGGLWQKNYYQRVPAFDARVLEERTLPNFDHIRKPYLTVSDFLQPYIIRLPYPVDNGAFFMGGYQSRQGKAEQGFALPLKRKILEYFSMEDLTGTLHDGKRMFELSALADGVKAILRIPVGKRKYVSYTRLYHNNKGAGNQLSANENENTGAIVDHQFSIGIYPFVATPQDQPAHYRIMLAERDFHTIHKASDCQLKFYAQSQPETAIPAIVRERSSKKSADLIGSRYYVLERAFDLIEISQHASSNLILPIFPPLLAPSKVFKFAIDFGTTNTHIEYQVNGEEPRPFEQYQEGHIKTLHDQESTETFFSANVAELGLTVNQLTRIFREEFVPMVIGGDASFRFPQRTVIYDGGTFNPDEANYALADFNIPFWYLKESLDLKQNRNSEVTPNLKWADFKANRKLERRTRAFLKQIMLMLRNKVLVNNGDPGETTIVLFYPSSMPRFRRQFLENAWNTYYQRYFAGAGQLFHLSESFAPFQYFRQKFGVQAMDRPVVSIDIGGGTTDVVIYTENQPQMLTSFQFASNALFGDGYGNTSANNGFIQKYEPVIRRILEESNAKNLNQVYDNIKARRSNSVELIEFFFSLQENKMIKDLNMPISFSKMLADDLEMRVVILFYYSAIIYHIACLMKRKSLQLPRYLTFSGNGSKVINMLSAGNSDATLVKFTKIIFEDVYKQEYIGHLELKSLDHPKEATCKGGLLLSDYQHLNDLEGNIREVLIGGADDQLISETPLTYSGINNEQLLKDVFEGVSVFIDKFFSWNDKLNYYNNFGISPGNFVDLKAVLKEDLLNFLKTGVDERQRQTNDNLSIPLEETLFFYPLNGAINKLAYHIQMQQHV